MPPFVPRHVSYGDNKITAFGGILTTEFLEPPPGRSFCFRQTYLGKAPDGSNEKLQKIIEQGKKPQGPPLHLHRHSVEYFKVEEGVLGLNLDGKIYKKTKDDPEFYAPPNVFHSFFRHPDSGEGPMTVVLSALDNGRDYKLDRVYFENWYGFWNDSLMHDGHMDFIQWAQIFDSGDAYPYVPKYVPFRELLSYLFGVIVGRWLGTLLGYKPFHREFTTDWDYAVEKMKGTFPLSLKSHESYKHERDPNPREIKPLRPYVDMSKVNGVNGVKEVNGVNGVKEVNGVNGVNGMNGKLYMSQTNGVNGKLHKSNSPTYE